VNETKNYLTYQWERNEKLLRFSLQCQITAVKRNKSPCAYTFWQFMSSLNNNKYKTILCGTLKKHKLFIEAIIILANSINTFKKG
jgi:hypothetical protein